MRCGLIVFVTLLSLPLTASAQTPVTLNGVRIVIGDLLEAPTPVGKAGLEEVEARIMMFDRDHDGLIAKDELIERMQDLITRGDRDGDAALDSSEIHMLALSPAARIPGLPASGGYRFSDQPGVSSRLHFEGALDDLRLASATTEQALALVQTFVDSIEATATTNLLKEMDRLLNADQLAEFKDALARQNNILTFSTRDSVVPVMVSASLDLGRVIQRLGLPPEPRGAAVAAIEQFKAQFRPGDAEKSALIDQMKGILSDEERTNFRAALDRRPLGKSGPMK